MSATMPNLRKHCSGVYRVTLTEDVFGQIQRNVDDEWVAEVRDTHTGNLKRYAGMWKSRREAYDELVSIPKIDL